MSTPFLTPTQSRARREHAERRRRRRRVGGAALLVVVLAVAAAALVIRGEGERAGPNRAAPRAPASRSHPCAA